MDDTLGRLVRSTAGYYSNCKVRISCDLAEAEQHGAKLISATNLNAMLSKHVSQKRQEGPRQREKRIMSKKRERERERERGHEREIKKEREVIRGSGNEIERERERESERERENEPRSHPPFLCLA